MLFPVEGKFGVELSLGVVIFPKFDVGVVDLAGRKIYIKPQAIDRVGFPSYYLDGHRCVAICFRHFQILFPNLGPAGQKGQAG